MWVAAEFSISAAGTLIELWLACCHGNPYSPTKGQKCFYLPVLHKQSGWSFWLQKYWPSSSISVLSSFVTAKCTNTDELLGFLPHEKKKVFFLSLCWIEPRCTHVVCSLLNVLFMYSADAEIHWYSFGKMFVFRHTFIWTVNVRTWNTAVFKYLASDVAVWHQAYLRALKQPATDLDVLRLYNVLSDTWISVEAHWSLSVGVYMHPQTAFWWLTLYHKT